MRWMKLETIIQSKVSQKEKHQCSIFLHILANTPYFPGSCLLACFNFSHLSGCEVRSYDFDLFFPNDTEHLLLCFLATFFREMSIQVLYPFKELGCLFVAV